MIEIILPLWQPQKTNLTVPRWCRALPNTKPHKPIMSLHKATSQRYYPNKLTTQTHYQNKLTTQINLLPKPKSGMICLGEVISWEERGTNAAP